MIAIGAFLIVALISIAASAHDPSGHHWHHDWYISQRQENGTTPCCGALAAEDGGMGGDAHFLPDRDIKFLGKGKYMVRINHKWMEYPHHVNPWLANPTGRNLIWYQQTDDAGIILYCLRLATKM